ncbi:phasin family protein [Rhodovibrio sodomensis]|uniref:phasin family protein n=1 Tax=Rhodovibrio sodomensis TaxID=1088 RepID=UPI001907776A|nr:TIGR01841 family phasin [Rhodovibrio sodomensis]
MASKTGNPFLDQNFTEMFDPRKYMDQFQVPGLDNKGFMEAHRKNIEALTEANRVAFEGAQAMARRQTEIVREAMDEAAKAMTQVQGAGSNEERVAKQTEIAKNTFETALKHARELAEMSAKSQNEALELLNKRVAESFDEMRDSMQTVVKQSEKATGQATKAAQNAVQTATNAANGTGQTGTGQTATGGTSSSSGSSKSKGGSSSSVNAN